MPPPTLYSTSLAEDCLLPPDSLCITRLVVFWLREGNGRTAVAWIFQMTNVAHAYFWHIWLPQGNKTLLMQGDHLLSVAGVLEQADLVHTRTHTGRRTDWHILSPREVYTDSKTHTCINSKIRQHLNFYTNWTLPPPAFFFKIHRVCQMCCKSPAVGWQWNAHTFLC